MSERTEELTKSNPLQLVTHDFDESITNDFKELMQVKDTNQMKKIKLNMADLAKILSKFPSLRRYNTPIQQMRALAISFYQVLSSHGEGAMPLVESDSIYQQLNKEIKQKMIGIPQSIYVKKMVIFS